MIVTQCRCCAKLGMHMWKIWPSAGIGLLSWLLSNSLLEQERDMLAFSNWMLLCNQDKRPAHSTCSDLLHTHSPSLCNLSNVMIAAIHTEWGWMVNWLYAWWKKKKKKKPVKTSLFKLAEPNSTRLFRYLKGLLVVVCVKVLNLIKVGNPSMSMEILVVSFEKTM